MSSKKKKKALKSLLVWNSPVMLYNQEAHQRAWKTEPSCSLVGRHPSCTLSDDYEDALLIPASNGSSRLITTDKISHHF